MEGPLSETLPSADESPMYPAAPFAASEYRELYEGVMQTAADGICVLDEALRIRDCNDALGQLVGVAREALIGRDAQELMTTTWGKSRSDLVDVLRHQDGWRGRVSLMHADGSLRHVELVVRQTELAVTQSNVGRLRFFGFAKDVTHDVEVRDAERNREAQLARISRLSTLGELASGIAHELNQPLAAIVNYTTGVGLRLRQRGESDEELLRALDQAAQQAQRAGGIIQRMRAFSHKGDNAVVRCALHRIIEETAAFLGIRSGSRRVRLQLALDAESDDVIADPLLVEQVLVNLIRNAEDAIEAVQDERDRRISVRTLTSSATSHLEVQVSDQGSGVPIEDRANLFTPFFTSKSTGLGLGLSISATIVRALGGRIWFTAPADGGSRFHFTLPMPTSNMVP